MEAPPLIRAMLHPSFYPHSPESVELVQTHISWVFLAGRLVYKVKKPVDFGFLDFTTLPKRAYYCRREVELNRRLAPDLYLGVTALKEKGGRFAPGGRGKVVDYAVVMRRLPESALLSSLLDRGRADGGMMRDLAELIVTFHAGAASGRGVGRFGSAGTLRFNTEENFSQTEKYAGVTIAPEDFKAIRAFARGFLERRKALIRRRVREGRVRDGHGDLHAEHVVFEEGRPLVIDCIEFTPRFRCADVASEVAFLAMDLEYRGAWPLARDFLSAYVERSDDLEILALLDYYLCYRAYVRGKINSFFWDDPRAPGAARQAAAGKARRYFTLAAAYARRGARPTLVATTGLVGTGKSTVAGLLAERLGFATVSSDVVRKRLAGIPPTRRVLEQFRGGLYSGAMSERTYAAMFEQGAELLAAGRDVVLDATFVRPADRLRALELARSAGAQFRLVETRCDEGSVRERLARRLEEDTSPSDGRWEIYLQQKRSWRPPSGLPVGSHFEVDTGMQPERIYGALLRGLYPLTAVSG